MFIPETSSSTDARVSSNHLPDSSSVAQSTSVSCVSTVTQSVLVSESAQVLVHSSAVSEGTMMVSDSTASTSSDLGSAIDKIIESTIGPDIMNGTQSKTDRGVDYHRSAACHSQSLSNTDMVSPLKCTFDQFALRYLFKGRPLIFLSFPSLRLYSCYQCRRWRCRNDSVSDITRAR